MASPGIPPIPLTANQFIEQQLDAQLKTIEGVFLAHALAFNGPLYMGVDDIFRAVIEKRHQTEPASEKLVILLTTTGGYLEPVQRM
ncbi:MAG TPA: hypothetical protein VFB79_08085, partial [Candidatus Angelobacter sp.]|nr:hypothetical protein [Candidatus Angelobacter sp.]